jgi:caffeoyl-CoA O-methyltransferase
VSELAKSFGQGDLRLSKYAEDTFKPEDSVLKQIRMSAKRAGLPEIHVGPMDALHLEVLTCAMNAKRAVEIGTLAGLSGVSIARGLSEDGKLFTLELLPENAKVAQASFELAGVARKVEILVGSALTNLVKLNKEGPFDLVFIDADKQNYPGYFQWAKQNLRKGGTLIADNTFAWGHVVSTKFPNKETEEEARGIIEFNRLIANDTSFKATILPTGEGLSIATKIY